MELVLFIGPQASGKSTFFKERFFDTHVRINLDMLKTRHREKVLLEACLAGKQPCVVDNTNPTVEDRTRYIPAAKAAGFRIIGYYFQSTLQECLARNQSRSGRKAIPIAGVKATHAKIEPPLQKEGFDDLHSVRIGSDGTFIVAGWCDEAG